MSNCPSVSGDVYLPDRFNFNKKHLICSTPVTNQGACSSSFAAAPVSAFNDRFCLLNNGLKKFDGSISHPLSCAGETKGCEGGSVNGTIDLMLKSGLVTTMCMDYDIKKAAHCPTSRLAKCHRRKADSVCQLNGSTEIKRDILKNGPVVASLPVTREFLVYASGIYEQTPGKIQIF